LIESPKKPYSLSAEQQSKLDKQINSDKKVYVDADALYNNLKGKYEL
jgi:hypothetical protein